MPAERPRRRAVHLRLPALVVLLHPERGRRGRRPVADGPHLLPGADGGAAEEDGRQEGQADRGPRQDVRPAEGELGGCAEVLWPHWEEVQALVVDLEGIWHIVKFSTHGISFLTLKPCIKQHRTKWETTKLNIIN